MKILQVATVSRTINAFLSPFAKQFRQQGWSVDAAARDIFEFNDVIIEHNKCFEISFCRNPLKIRQLYLSLKQIRRLIVEQNYDVVHVHTPIAAFLTRFACIGLKRTKVFYTAHGFHYINTNPRWKNFIFYVAEKMAGFFTDHLFVINNDDYKFATENKIVPQTAITKIHGIGVKPEKYQFCIEQRAMVRNQLQLAKNTFVLLHVAELNSNKNQQVVLHALSILKRKYALVDLKYLIVGEGPSLDDLKLKVEELQLEDVVEFLGKRNDIAALLSACDVLSLSSRREGLPRCMLEAMCNGKPIIASRIRGCTDLLSSGAGVLVAYNDASQWAHAIEQLYSSLDTRNHMGLIGRQLIQERYQESMVVSEVLKVYKREFGL